MIHVYHTLRLVFLAALVQRLAAVVIKSSGTREEHVNRTVAVAPKRNVSTPIARQPKKDFILLQSPSDDRDRVLVRPSAGEGADVVRFGVIAKNFYGTELKNNRFTIDIVLSIRWMDPRVVDLIPDGLEKVSMAWGQAKKLIWMPGIVVANKDIKAYEIIAASVTLLQSGEVLRTERALVRCMKKFNLVEYPFDSQALEIKVVSSKYMLNEVVLEPNMNASFVEEGLWGLYKIEDWNASVYEEGDGDLKKSRGMLEIRVKRQLEKYFDDHLVPVFIVLMISWAVFYFPFAPPFITPRLALSVLALLTFTNLMLKSSRELPGSAPFNWNDLFNQQVEALMFTTIVTNISTEVVYHQLGMEVMARAMNNEAKVLIPVAGIINVGIVLSAGSAKWMSLYWASHLCKVLICVFILAYGGYCGWALNNIKKLRKAEEEAALEASTGSRSGP